MNERTLGRTGLRCSEIGLGTWAFASTAYGACAGRDARETVRAALDLGVTLFDTAPMYGTRKRVGMSEEILGAALGADRGRVLVSSKFGRYPDPIDGDFSSRRARESVEGSLKRLGTDRLDVLFFHSPFGPEEVSDDVWGELESLKREGKIRFVGHSVSAFERTQGMARDWAAERKIDLVQVVYSLLNRESAVLIRDLGQDGVAVLAREALANGFLSGTVGPDTVFPKDNLNSRYGRREILDRVEQAGRLSFLVRGDVRSLPQAAYRWILDNGDVSVALSGAKSRAELEEVVAASRARPYSPEEHARSDALHARDFAAA